MQFHKYQALGNDFIVIRESELKTVTTNYGEFAKRICDRHFGAGADGMEVILDRKSVDEADYEIRLYNADGGETPISGNGTRCVAAYLYVAERWLKPKVRIATAAGVKILTLLDREGGYCEFKMEVGTPKFASSEIPVHLDPPLAQVIRQKLNVDGQDIEFTATSMGNPHCSILVNDFDTINWRKLSAAIEIHPAFPDRTNVEFVRVLNRNEIEVRFWERGVGETLASGTGSCGAALAAMLNGVVERKVQVKTVSGAMEVEWRADDVVIQTGEARAVYSGEWIR
ncbi:MAG TPA: diaminopimelate epimerase [Blastocatellia bacterium]|nr:diaminopimelate epimerase [Blastocatellia bacterium]